MLQAGQRAPEVDLPNADMQMVSLASFKGKRNVVLYFYPKDDTPGCTIQAIDFSDHESDFADFDTVVLGVSMDDCLSHGSFSDKHGLSVQLLADADGEICRQFDVLHTKEAEGRKKVCIMRSTFIIDKHGVLRHALYGVSARGHAAEMLRLVKKLNSHGN
ncbi:MAG: peroxiredoxin [Burkholderiales bacterium]|nr:peroxiredoxin [Burkholderiales bacterium]MDQ3196385.1 peroxiredoxin [Pseudomonadota bacterium]